MPRRKPNILFFFCDDLGWGDVSCLNPDSKIHTPHIDGLADSGVNFTDAHAGSAVCTPSRYTLLTGRYCWRSRLKSSVNGGYSPALIPPERPTVASRLRDAGYRTACIGKWHVGMDWSLKAGVDPSLAPDQQLSSRESGLDSIVDFTKPVRNGPVDVGFDYYFGISASLDMAPYVYIENDRVTDLPTDHSPAGEDELRARAGCAAPGWSHEAVLPELERRTAMWLEDHVRDNQSANGEQDRQPFFLYVPINGPHTPVVPTAEWRGKSGCGIYGDFVMQIDGMVGSIIATLERLGIRDETAFFVSSDNGPETLTAPYRERYDHLSAWKFRGMKRDNWEGGHRIPYIVNWPAAMGTGRTCDTFVELADFYATAIAMAGVRDEPARPAGSEVQPPSSPPTTGGEDSFSMLGILLDAEAPGYRDFAVHHSCDGRWAIRRGAWKLLLHSGSGGNSYDCPENNDPVQLYNMETDPFETNNVYDAHPDLVQDLRLLCLDIIRNGRSTPGPIAQNDGGPGEDTHWRQLQEFLKLDMIEAT